MPINPSARSEVALLGCLGTIPFMTSIAGARAQAQAVRRRSQPRVTSSSSTMSGAVRPAAPARIAALAGLDATGS